MGPSRLVETLKSELESMMQWVDEIPPVQQAMRYGNAAYKQWHARMIAYAPQLVCRLTGSLEHSATAVMRPGVQAAAVERIDGASAAAEADEVKPLPTSFIASALPTRVEYAASLKLSDEERRHVEHEAAQTAAKVSAGVAASSPPVALSPTAIGELAGYLSESFGNATRIDYGTGHELAFLVFLRCLDRLGVLQPSDRRSVVLVVLHAYLTLMRHVQNTYKLEPAGSHGVWGLDDYQFAPFLLGAAQLVGHPEVAPNSIHDDNLLQAHAPDFLYLAAIKFIKQMKRGHFGEHSPMLNDISALGSWRTVASGLARMYEGEVLGKMQVVQHLPFGTLLVWAGDS